MYCAVFICYCLLSLTTTHCHLLSLAVIQCHSLSLGIPLVVICCTTRCHSLSLVAALAVIRCNLLSLDVSLVCLFMNNNLQSRVEGIQKNHIYHTSSKPRPVIVKFARYNIREKVFKSKKNLSRLKMSDLNEARERVF